MSKSNHATSLEFIKQYLESSCPCTRSSCKGSMVLVLVRYEPNGPLNREYECCSCGKIKKDPVYAAQRKKQYEDRRKRYENRK